MKKIVAIWAEDKNGLIGIDGHLPWSLPAELAHFKETTLDSMILMGRKTFDGMNQRLLPRRETLVLTHDRSLEMKGVRFLYSRLELLDYFKNQEKNLYIIGGSELFSLFQNDFDELVRTVVVAECQGDTYFPSDFPFNNFKIKSEKKVAADKKNNYNFIIQYYQRKLDV
ncbi:MAG: dihydrofolate reductase [Lactovum sp.]